MSDEAAVDLGEVDEILEQAGFDPEECVLTRRQAEVLALRERDFSQRSIATALGTSRANISSIEASARRNVRKARETVGVAEALRPPVRVPIAPGTDLYDVPEIVYASCDDADTKVAHVSAELVRRVRRQADTAVEEQSVVEPISVVVAPDGSISVELRA